MTPIRTVTPDFAVAPQLRAEDIAAAAKAGYRALICNRPDGESGDQLSAGEAEAACQAEGLAFHYLPFTGPPPAAVVERLASLMAAAPGPILAYCRSGTRSITAWAYAQAAAGQSSADEIIALCRQAGYDLAGAQGTLKRLGAA